MITLLKGLLGFLCLLFMRVFVFWSVGWTKEAI